MADKNTLQHHDAATTAGATTRPTDPARATSALRSSRAYGCTLALGLLGATAVAVGVSRPWVAATATVPGLPTIRATAAGAELSPLAGALGVVILAAFGAVVATGGWLRRGLGVLISGAALVVLIAALWPPDAAAALQDGLSARGWSGGDYDRQLQVWRWVVVAAAALCLAAGAVVARAGSHWPTMGSRYEVPAVTTTPGPEQSHRDPTDAGGAVTSDHAAQAAKPPAEVMTDEEVWREIDRGHDPTQTR